MNLILITENVHGEKRGAYVGPWVTDLFGFWLVTPLNNKDAPDGVFKNVAEAEKSAREALRDSRCPMWIYVK